MNNSQLDATSSIQAYFSHSYRSEDREVNLPFWELFSKEGFFFTIDPKSDTFIIPQLERLMRYSDCFIAVVTRRSKEFTKIDNITLSKPQTIMTYSPYIAFENFLAELAAKPRLLFVEHGLDSNVFGTDECVHTFRRNFFDKDKDNFEKIVHNFANQVRTHVSYNKQLDRSAYTRKAGILLQESQDPSGYSSELINRIKGTLRVGGYSSKIIPPQINNGLQEFIRQLDDLELIVIDVCDAYTTADALAVIHAKAIPCIRIAKFNSNNSLDMSKSQGLLKDYFIENDIPIITWKDDVEELITNLLLYLRKFQQELTPLDTLEKGNKYFKSAGRKPAKIFISNPGSLNPLALELVQELQTSNIQYFQYQSNSSIEVGRKWEEVLEQELRESNIFVALVNEDYHNSKYCQKELRVAFERWEKNEVTILPYLCERTRFPDLIRDHIQGQAVHALTRDRIVRTVADQIEKELLKKEDPKMKETRSEITKQSESKKKVLFLASNPSQTQQLKLDEEIRSIGEKIRASEYRDNLDLVSHFATRPDDLQQMLLVNRPTIVHFSGHGNKDGEIILMDNNRKPKSVNAAALKSLFKTLKDNVRVVILNACYSKIQANAISEVIDFVIGMNDSISDDAAIAFSASFYRAIGFGRTIQEAFDSGITAILLEGISEEDTPEILIKQGADASSTRLI
ncbi:MAG: TIR domain-containing protein [Anaerolineales bacterium]|nr:TIR domain-containing protein [Anaerolineales bacterium]